MTMMIRKPVRWFCLLSLLVAGVLGSTTSRAAAADAPGTPAEALQTLPDFKVERLMIADKAKNGSWINLGKDNKGRLLLGGQNGQPVTRGTLAHGEGGTGEGPQPPPH